MASIRKDGIIGVTKALLYGEREDASLSIVDTQTTQSFFQFITGSHSYNRKSLQYLIETGYVMNPVIFGIINKILYASKNLKVVPYRNGKVYKSATFEFDLPRALFNLATTGTCVIWDKPIVGFGTEKVVLDTVNVIEECYTRGVFKYWVDNLDGTRTSIPTEQLQFKKFYDNPSRLTNFGLSPLQAAIMPIEALKEMYTADTSLLKNKGVELLISNGGDAGVPIPVDDMESFDEAMNKRIAGAKKYGKVATTTANVQVHQLGKTIKELALWDGYNIKIKDVCIVLQMPLTLAGDKDASKLANYEESRKAMYQECIIPLTQTILDKKFEQSVGYECFIDTSGVDCLQEAENVRAEKAKTHQTAILELNTNVNSGNISREIALNVLVTEWNFEIEEAELVIMDKSKAAISTTDKVNVLSPIVATKVLESMTTDERRDLVGLGHVEGGDTIPQPKPSF